MQVLVIDDEPFILWLTQLLQQNHQEVTWVKSPAEARAKIAQGGFDSVIVDILMPAPTDSQDPDKEAEIMGLILCQEILKTGWAKDKVAVYSIITDTEFHELASRVGMQPTEVVFFSKRDDPTAFLKHLQKMLRF
jgi:CheY-like chemotaxis protein